ncbi:MAG: BNR repeat-containing protein [Clostridiales bacterium]|nr:BNR repeat-containing protein [Clostridiales bacterium]
MIITERAVERRIKRANTDWWINEKAIVGMNGKTYIAYFTDMGEVHVKEIDAKCSRALSRDVCLCRLNGSYADEHNSPSICILENGRIMVVYSAHAATNTLKYRVTDRPFDLFSFGPEKTLEYGGSVTYAQVFENTRRHEIWLFTRVRSVTWEFRCSGDEGETWSDPVTFLRSDAGGLFYFDVRKQLVPDETGSAREQWFFALYGHPRISKDHTIRAGIFDAEGCLLRMNGAKNGMDLFGHGASSELVLSDLDVVYASEAGTTVRLLEVSPTLPLRVGLAAFVLNKPETITYFVATWTQTGFRLSAPICKGGEFLSPDTQLDGSQTYVGGMACYYGVGAAGIRPDACGETVDTDRIFIARFDGTDRVLESYVSRDHGMHYGLEQVIRRLNTPDQKKIWRPVVPIHAQDNLPVYWHEGIYSAHTGGWHCDAVMLTEYDD